MSAIEQNERFKFFLHLICVSISLLYFVWKLYWFLSKNKKKCFRKLSINFVWWTPSLFWHLLQTMFFIDIGSKVTPQNRINVKNTGTTQRRHKKLYMYFLIWISLHWSLRLIPVTGISKSDIIYSAIMSSSKSLSVMLSYNSSMSWWRLMLISIFQSFVIFLSCIMDIGTLVFTLVRQVATWLVDIVRMSCNGV